MTSLKIATKILGGSNDIDISKNKETGCITVTINGDGNNVKIINNKGVKNEQ